MIIVPLINAREIEEKGKLNKGNQSFKIDWSSKGNMATSCCSMIP
jgi:hypothetical protein